MTPPRYFVDARRSVPFDTLEETKSFAQQNFPAVILDRIDSLDGKFSSREVLRFDWRWNAQRHVSVIDFG
jgi:hypothetical protein